MLRTRIQRLSPESWLRASGAFVLAAALCLALPALLIPLGLGPEGDAVDYRIPLVKWVLRHGHWPVWPWTMVDDYPALGEMLMVPLQALRPGFARLVPIAGYLGLGAAGGALLATFGAGGRLRASTLFLVGAAWAVALRPVAIQANLLMVDDLAAAFLLGALACVLRGRALFAGVFAAAALATRYTTWGSVALLPFLVLVRAPRERRVRDFLGFSLIAFLGAAPFLLRNSLANGNPFFPIGSREAMAAVAVSDYGRGRNLVSFLLLPWDLLYTNTFVRGFYDYTVGKLFYFQLALAAWPAWRMRAWRPRSALGLALLFSAGHLVIWFASGQQMRFLVPALVIWNLALLSALLEAGWLRVAAFLTAAGVFSCLSVNKDSLLIAVGLRPIPFANARAVAADCFARAGVGEGPVGFVRRDGVLGFFDFDFFFLPGHPYGLRSAESAGAPWVYSLEPRPGYEPWPRENPCLLRKRP